MNRFPPLIALTLAIFLISGNVFSQNSIAHDICEMDEPLNNYLYNLLSPNNEEGLQSNLSTGEKAEIEEVVKELREEEDSKNPVSVQEIYAAIIDRCASGDILQTRFNH